MSLKDPIIICLFNRPIKSEPNTLKMLPIYYLYYYYYYCLTEYFSNVIYRRVSRGHPAKNPHSYELVQESFDM